MLCLKDFSVKRSFDWVGLNTVLNHPDVFFDAGGVEEPLDVSGALANPDNVYLKAKGGGFLFAKSAPGLFHVHTQFLPAARGRPAVRAARDAISYMFLATEAMELVSWVADDNRAARQFCGAAGMAFQYRRAEMMPSCNGLKNVRFYRTEFWDWLWSQSWLSEIGAWFHDKLHSEQDRLGLALDHHVHDDAHNRMVGAAVLMALFGQPDKAEVLYNRWAGLAAYEPIRVVSRAPLIININECSIYLTHDTVEVLPCQLEQQ